MKRNEFNSAVFATLRLHAVLLVLAALWSSRAQAQTKVIAYAVPAAAAGNQNVTGASLGMDFDVANEIIVTRLGVFDSDSDGLKTTLTARLWNRDTVTELATLEFTPESPGELIGGNRFKDLPTPLRLAAGFHGTISQDGYSVEEKALNSHGAAAGVVWTLNDGAGSILFVGSSRYGGAGAYPDSADGGPAARYAAGTFEFQTTPALLPGTPVVTAKGADGKITLAWPAVTQPAPAAKYRVQRAADGAGPFTQVAEVTEAGYTDAGLANGTVYFYKVIAVTAGGKESPASAVKSAAAYVVAAEHHIAYFTPGGLAGSQAYGGPLGMDFDVQNPIVVKRLGVFDENSDGLKLPLAARIWNRATQEIVAELNFTPEDPGTLIEGMRFKALSQPLRLETGFQGVIQTDGYGAEERFLNSDGNPARVVWTLNSGNGSIVFVGSSRYGTQPGTFPDSPDGGSVARYAAGTFEFQALPPEVPGTPAAKVSLPFEDAVVTLSWPAVTDPLPAAKYEVSRGAAADGPFTKIGETAGLTYQDSTVTNGTEYFYTVRAISASGKAGASSAAQGAKPNPRQAGIAYLVPSGTVGNQNVTGASLGLDFDVGKSVKITKLGVFDDSGDGLKAALTVAIFDRGTKQPVITAEFTESDSGELIDGSRFKMLAQPLVLEAGFQGSVVAWGYNDVEMLFNTHGGGTGNLRVFDGGSLVFVGSSRYGTSGQFPGTADGGPVNRFAAGTFYFEPVTTAARPTIQVARVAAGLKLTWGGGGSLEKADALGGSWQAVAGAASGVEIPATGATAYFRVRQ